MIWIRIFRSTAKNTIFWGQNAGICAKTSDFISYNYHLFSFCDCTNKSHRANFYAQFRQIFCANQSAIVGFHAIIFGIVIYRVFKRDKYLGDDKI